MSPDTPASRNPSWRERDRQSRPHYLLVLLSSERDLVKRRSAVIADSCYQFRVKKECKRRSRTTKTTLSGLFAEIANQTQPIISDEDPVGDEQNATYVSSFPPAPLEIWGRRYVASIADYVRTGQPEDWKQKEEDLAFPRQESAAERWGIPSSKEFDRESWTNEMASRESGGPEGEGEIEKVASILSFWLRKLRFSAQGGNPAATRLLATVARDTTSSIESLPPEARHLVREVAERSNAFPILISKNSDQCGRKHILENLRDLNIGARAPMNATGYDIRASNEQPFKAPLHDMCMRLRTVIDVERSSGWLQHWTDMPTWMRNARTLPPLSQPTSRAGAEAWFAVAWEVLCSATGGSPESLPQFENIGAYKHSAIKTSSQRMHKYPNKDQRGLHERLHSAWMKRFSR